MSKIQVNDIVNHYDTGAPQFPKGVAVSGGSTIGVDVGTGASVYSPSDNVLTLGTNNAERLRVDSNGRVLIGTTTEGHTSAQTLTVGNNTSGHTGITIRSSPSYIGSLYFSDATSSPAEYSGFLQYSHNGNFLTLGTDSAERLRIISNGNVGIGTTNPERKLSVLGPNAMVQIEGTGGNGKQWSIISSDDITGGAAAAEPGNFVIYDDTSGGLGDVLTLTGVAGSMGLGTQEPAAKLHVAAGNIKVDSGYGIDFSATQGGSATSSILDDYEEGTWTPVFSGETTAGSFSYATQVGYYTKIGKVVYYRCILTNINQSGSAASGSMRITGLPYQCQSDSSYEGTPPRADNFTFNGEYFLPLVNNNSSSINFYIVRSGNSDVAMNVSARDSDLSDLIFTGWYFTP